jgi:steroid 5-alpha reductase family enzyme
VTVARDQDHRRLLLAVALCYGAALAAGLATGACLGGRHPVLVAAGADLVATLAVFACSAWAGNSSLYDPYWSAAPLPVAAYWWLSSPGGSPARAAAALALTAAWGARLTWNCLARWRSLAREDFRYREIRARTGRLYWPASLVAIHLLPTAWVFLGLLPLYPALSRPGRPPGALDALAALVAGGGIALEAVADLQLRRFLSARRDPAAVLGDGLWALCRHPNYLGEILFWWGLWLFGLAADPAWAWTAVGPAAITLLFVLVSAPWMDRRMLAGHPAFAGRIATVPALFPWPGRKG